MKSTVLNSTRDSRGHLTSGPVLRGVDEADAEQLYSLIGLLVVEGRVPVNSPKGRVVGPHAYKGGDGSGSGHFCDRSDKCTRAAVYRDQLVRFGRHLIPLSLEVILLPDCPHHEVDPLHERRENMTPGRDQHCLLEQWTIQVTQRSRHVTDHIEPLTALLNTVSSYLHFSQLSAWLVENSGVRPKNIYYRFAVPRESSLQVLSENYQVHNFPRIGAGESCILEVSMLSLHRQSAIPRLMCGICDRIASPYPSTSHVNSTYTDSAATASAFPDFRRKNSPAGFTVANSNTAYSSAGDVGSSHLNGPSHAPTVYNKRPTTFLDLLRSSPPPYLPAPLVPTKPGMGPADQQPYNQLSSGVTLRHASILGGVGTGANRRKALSESVKKGGQFDMPSDAEPFFYGQSVDPPNRLDLGDSGASSSSHSTQHQHYNNVWIEKDPTPYPKKETLDDVIAEFAQFKLDECNKANLSGSDTDITSDIPYPLPQDLGSLGRRDSRKKKKERRILFSDSSSSESLDRVPGAHRFPRLPPPATTHGPHSLASSMESLLDSTEIPYPSPSPSTLPASTVPSSLCSGGQTAPSPLAIARQPKPASNITSSTSTSSPTPTPTPSHLDQTSGESLQRLVVHSTPISTSADGNKANGHSFANGHSAKVAPEVAGSSNDKPSIGVMKSPSLLTKLTGKKLENCADPASLLREKQIARGRVANANGVFHRKTGLPLRSSPAPMKRNSSGKFDFDNSFKLKTAKSAQCVSLTDSQSESDHNGDDAHSNKLSVSAPVGQNLVVNFEESMLNGRIHPIGVVEGFSLELGASGSFCPAHTRLPLTAYFFHLSDDNAPSPYLGYVDLGQLANKRGYHVPKKGSMQLTLFNPSGAVLKVFVVLYDLTDMPANSQTFLRQRTLYMPVAPSNQTQQPANCSPSTRQQWGSPCLRSPNNPLSGCQLSSTDGNVKSMQGDKANSTKTNCDGKTTNQAAEQLPSYLRYLVHLRFHTTKTGKLYLHTDIRLIFSRDKFEFDPRVATYELRSFVEAPINPRYSPKK